MNSVFWPAVVTDELSIPRWGLEGPINDGPLESLLRCVDVDVFGVNLNPCQVADDVRSQDRVRLDQLEDKLPGGVFFSDSAEPRACRHLGALLWLRFLPQES